MKRKDKRITFWCLLAIGDVKHDDSQLRDFCGCRANILLGVDSTGDDKRYQSQYQTCLSVQQRKPKNKCNNFQYMWLYVRRNLEKVIKHKRLLQSRTRVIPEDRVTDTQNKQAPYYMPCTQHDVQSQNNQKFNTMLCQFRTLYMLSWCEALGRVVLKPVWLGWTTCGRKGPHERWYKSVKWVCWGFSSTMLRSVYIQHHPISTRHNFSTPWT